MNAPSPTSSTVPFGANIPDWAAALYMVLGLFLVGLGMIGRRLSLKHYERNRFHVYLARRYREALESLFPLSGYASIRIGPRDQGYQNNIINEMGSGYVRLITSRLHRKWLMFFWFVILFGVALALLPPLLTGALRRWLMLVVLPI
jgi:hypothetical protein